ncbi:carbamoyltransferase HypF [Picosynechococcus sp. NKBG15041c]|uniref:carbamoyltransferase HypF n=1 Tax=Picosynechococcus sp. NKBG15041c TaxID=1407650 RepID=UPI0003FABDB3|nr:carbamoyltransferase HypF [Picosynechococcus sp. NKBG15041c]
MQQRRRLTITGTVQGVGFRPFVYQVAQELGLTGWVSNSAAGVVIEIEGGRSPLDSFFERLQTALPVNARIDTLTSQTIEPVGDRTFSIRTSQTGEKTALILPDLATCSACLREIFDPNNRRYQYPFTNCTHCGPRYSIIETLPYDRPRTAMAQFPMCTACQQEYENPGDRRFHAQPNACPDCGPQLTFCGNDGVVIARKNEALQAAVEALKQGKIVALKGLGGFQLLVDARNFQAVQILRDRKGRPHKPFAVMYPDLNKLKQDCLVSEVAKTILVSAASPIVLLPKKETILLAQNVAPDNPYLGVILPYTPLHHLLLKKLDFPVVATSGNLSNEPICIDNQAVMERLQNIADYFLSHNRPILRAVDDSVIQIIHQTPVILRRARGYAPEPIYLKKSLPKKILAVGAHLKNTVAIGQDRHIFLSQHIGDLSNPITLETAVQTLQKLSQIYDFQPDIIACDRHPDYLSTHYAKNLAESLSLPLIQVQHHEAHLYACIAEYQLEPPILGIAWDGTGYGTDGSIWGGEFFRVTAQGCDRLAHFKPFPLPGGDRATREPRRSALGFLSQGFNLPELKSLKLSTLQAFTETELNVLWSMLEKKINSPLTSSAGRIFDAIASILDVHQCITFEGQAAMALEFLAQTIRINEAYNFTIDNQNFPREISLEITIREILQDFTQGISKTVITAKFHNTLTEIILTLAQQTRIEQIVLTGGCFQNKYLLERTIQKLEQTQFKVYYPQKIPPNDGAIALGQIIAVARGLPD